MNEEGQIVITTDDFQLLLESQEMSNEQLQIIVDYIRNKQEQEKQEQEKQEQEKQEQEKQEQEKQEQEQQEKEKQEKQDQKNQAEQKSAEEVRETREVDQAQQISEIHDMIDLQNQFYTGQFAFLGVIVGILLMKIFFERFWK